MATKVTTEDVFGSFKEFATDMKAFIATMSQPVPEFSVRAKAFNEENECFCSDTLDYTPNKLIVGSAGNSINDVVERVLLASGNITREEWEKMKGIQYDIDTDTMDEDFDKTFDDDEDDFVQSNFAGYETDEVPIEKVEVEEKPKKTSKKKAPETSETTTEMSEIDQEDPTLPLD